MDTEEKTEIKKQGTDENIIKITISKEAEKAVSDVVMRVNEGFEGGKVTRQDVASFILVHFKANCQPSDINVIRANFYSEEAMLEAIVRRMKETGEMPEFLKEALRKQWQASADSPRKPKRSLTKEHTNDVLTANEYAA